ncbi:MAG: hypothetical protein QOI95_893 [Acidimicrobiaceae bacterium]|jgi:hypothetical protein
MVHTCPRCELRFLTAAELTEHLRVDHHLDTDGFERFQYKPLEQRPATKRYLVVGNETLMDDTLVERMREQAQDGHIHLVVPATSGDGGAAADDKGLGLATFRMRHAIDKLLEAGVHAEGEVGVSDPIRAAARALEHEPADAIIVLTLPHDRSKWLHVDVPKALEHRFGLPVTVLTASH